MSAEGVNQFGIFRGAEEVDAYPAGAVIFRAGDPADRLYVVRSGRVGIKVGEGIVEVLEENGMFGEMALIDDAPRSADAVALTDCEVVAVDRARFRSLVQATPFFAERVMRVMVDRLRRATAPAEAAPGSLDTPERIG